MGINEKKMKKFLLCLLFLSSWVHYGCLGSSSDDKVTVKKDTKTNEENGNEEKREKKSPKNPAQPAPPEETLAFAFIGTFQVTDLTNITDSHGNAKKGTDDRSLSITITSPNVSKWYITHDSTFDPRTSATAAKEGTDWSWLTTKPTTHTLSADVPDGEVTLYLWVADARGKVKVASQASNSFLLDTYAPRFLTSNSDMPANRAVDSVVTFSLTVTDLTEVRLSYCFGSGCTPATSFASFPLTLADSEVPFGSNSITLQATDEFNRTHTHTHTWTRYQCSPNDHQTETLTNINSMAIGKRERVCASTGLNWQGGWHLTECKAGYDNTQDSTICAPTAAGFFSPARQMGRTPCNASVAQKPNTHSHWRKSQKKLTSTSQCAWDCDEAFYKSGNTCVAVSPGYVAAEASTQQTPCQGNQVPNGKKSTCVDCGVGTHPSTDHSECENNTRNCVPAIQHGQGRQTWNLDDRQWTVCQITSCDAGYDTVTSSTACGLTPKGYFSTQASLGRESCADHVTLPSFADWVNVAGLGQSSECDWDCQGGYTKNQAQDGCTATSSANTLLVTDLTDATDHRGEAQKATKSRSLSLGITSPNASKWYVTHDSAFDPQDPQTQTGKGTDWSWLTTKPTTHLLPADVPDGEVTLYLWMKDAQDDLISTTTPATPATGNSFLLDTTGPALTVTDQPPKNNIDTAVTFELTATDTLQIKGYRYCLGANCETAANPQLTAFSRFPLALSDSQVPYGSASHSIFIEAEDDLGNTSSYTYTWTRADPSSTDLLGIISFPTITSANAAAYPISGNCPVSQNAQEVTVSVGGIAPSPQPTCSSGAWQATLDVTSLSGTDGSIAITADQTGMDQATASAKNSFLCPRYFVPVPPLAGYTTHSFCVAKYEMKSHTHSTDPSVVKALSQPENPPWVEIQRKDAIAQCTALGAGYDLITNDEWQSLARNIEKSRKKKYPNMKDGLNQPAFSKGHSDRTPAQALSASPNDGEACFQTGVDSSCSGNHDNWWQDRTQKLSNGRVIWDMAGNVWEWVKDDNKTYLDATSTFIWKMTDSTHPSQGTLEGGLATRQRRAKGHFGPHRDYSPHANAIFIKLKNGGYGLGYAFLDAPQGAILRGGGWDSGISSGIFTTSLNYAATHKDTDLGFRCVYHPEKDTDPLPLLCQEPMDPGDSGENCIGHARIVGGQVCPRLVPSVKYYFDPRDEACKPFGYNGVLGNRNRFETFEACQGVCGGSETPLPPQLTLSFTIEARQKNKEAVILDWTEPLDKPDSLQPYLFRKKDTVWTQEEEKLIARVLKEKNCSLTNSSSDIYCVNYFTTATHFIDHSSLWTHKKGEEFTHHTVPAPRREEKYFYRLVIPDASGGVYAQVDKSIQLPQRPAKCYAPPKVAGDDTSCPKGKKNRNQGTKWSFVSISRWGEKPCQRYRYEGCSSGSGPYNRFPNKPECTKACKLLPVVEDVDVVISPSPAPTPASGTSE